MAGFVDEFKEFAVKGNVMDLAIGVIIGAAFAKIVDSLVKDILMPVLGAPLKGIDLSALYINLSGKTYPSYADALKDGAAVIGYGAFLNNLIQFLFLALAVFMMVKAINHVRREPPAAPPAPSKTEELLAEIRDELAMGRAVAPSTRANTGPAAA